MKNNSQRQSITFRIHADSIKTLESIMQNINSLSKIHINKTDIINFLILNASEQSPEKLLKEFIKYIA